MGTRFGRSDFWNRLVGYDWSMVFMATINRLTQLEKTKRGSVLGLTHFMKRQVKLCTLLNKPFGWNAQDLQLGKSPDDERYEEAVLLTMTMQLMKPESDQ